MMGALDFTNRIKQMGATDGIGKQYALQLAEQGLNIVLIGRSPEKLKATESEVRMRSNVQVKTVVVDYSGGREIYDDVERELAGLEIGVLVNNVGMGYARMSEFLDMERDLHLRMLNVNMMSCVAMTYIVLPQMVERKRGLVINIASLAGVVPHPFVATYSATKVFVCFFSRILKQEYKEKGIQFQLVTPGFVSTNMTSQRDVSAGCPTAETYVRSAIATVGLQSRTAGYLMHDLFGAAIQLYSERALLKELKNEMIKFKAKQCKSE
ncbi:PREDICTED: very-long-chain 3-oxoacyl-CoA reductase-like [Priapulus caudatus]|uniref:Very-long-chain 3-oxoacyl-CoA reductase-like n=1 Tax=Priapulus caudatus TaxID=37621 RepID=A0ABM1EXA7_PRICU|nr:PREDICTED: very-long-chain 3-oxoacyl-CoA reductase-like [Priapulus caudatus]